MINIEEKALAAEIIREIENQYWCAWEGAEFEVEFYKKRIMSFEFAFSRFCTISTYCCYDNGMIESVTINGVEYRVDLDALIDRYERKTGKKLRTETQPTELDTETLNAWNQWLAWTEEDEE